MDNNLEYRALVTVPVIYLDSAGLVIDLTVQVAFPLTVHFVKVVVIGDCIVTATDIDMVGAEWFGEEFIGGRANMFFGVGFQSPESISTPYMNMGKVRAFSFIMR